MRVLFGLKPKHRAAGYLFFVLSSRIPVDVVGFIHTIRVDDSAQERQIKLISDLTNMACFLATDDLGISLRLGSTNEVAPSGPRGICRVNALRAGDDCCPRTRHSSSFRPRPRWSRCNARAQAELITPIPHTDPARVAGWHFFGAQYSRHARPTTTADELGRIGTLANALPATAPGWLQRERLAYDRYGAT